MQIFIPFPDITASVQCLDNRRLGKQRVEASQILNIYFKQRFYGEEYEPQAYDRHPVTHMWQHAPGFLIQYYNACLEEWEKRGFKNIKLQPLSAQGYLPGPPVWWGIDLIHRSHRSQLYQKNPLHYPQFSHEPAMPAVYYVNNQTHSDSVKLDIGTLYYYLNGKPRHWTKAYDKN